MKKIEVLKVVKQYDFIVIHEYSNGYDIDITVKDFDGFDEHWNEIMLDYNENLEDELLEFLTANASKVVGDYYRSFTFEDCEIVYGYASMDI